MPVVINEIELLEHPAARPPATPRQDAAAVQEPPGEQLRRYLRDERERTHRREAD